MRVFLAGRVLLFASLACYFGWWRPNAKLRDSEWWASATPCEQLVVSRQVIALPMGSYHDAALTVLAHRDRKSVSNLITSLRWQEWEDGDVMLCTRAHTIKAIQTITGAAVGDTAREWRRWWRIHGTEPRWQETECH